MAISYPLSLLLEDLDLVALDQANYRSLGVGPPTLGEPEALRLALPVQRVHLCDLDVPDRLDRLADLGLVRPWMNEERVRVLIDQGIGLLTDDRRDDHVTRVLLDRRHALASVFSLEPVNRSNAERVKTRWSATSTSYVDSEP